MRSAQRTIAPLLDSWLSATHRVTTTEPIRPPPLPGILGCRAVASISHGSRSGHKTRQKSETRATPEQIVKDIRRATRKHHSAEEKVRVVLEGLRGEYSIAELCRREGIAESLYYSWSKEFLEAAKLPRSSN